MTYELADLCTDTRGAIAARARTGRGVIALAWAAAACSGPPTITSVGPDAASGDAFSRADDFGVAGCTPGGLAGVDPAGIWHLALDFGFGAAPGAIRLDPGGQNGYAARLFGRAVDRVAVDADSWLLRRVFATADGRERIQALLLCAPAGADPAADDGAVIGAYASCTDGECGVAQAAGARLTPLPGPDARGVVEVGSHAGSAWPPGTITVNVRQRDGLAYLARYDDGLRIVDVSDPARPIERGHAPVADPGIEIYNDVKLADGPDGRRYAIAASSRRGAVVYDVTDPDAPAEVATFPGDPLDLGVNVHALFIDDAGDGARAYAANISLGGIDVVDIADPAQPRHLGSWAHPAAATQFAFVHDLFVEDGRAYLNYWNLGLVIADTRDDPADPAVLGQLSGYAGEYGETSHSSWVVRAGGRTVAVHGDEGYGAHVRIVDVDPASAAFLEVVGSFQTRPHVSVHNVMAHEALALVTYYQDGLRVLDLSNPAQPVEVANYNSWPGAQPGYGESFYEGAIGVDYDPATGTIYLADTHRGLIILALQTP